MSSHEDRGPQPERWSLSVLVSCHGCGRQTDGHVAKSEWLDPHFINMRDDNGAYCLQTVLCPVCAKWHPRFWFKGKRIGYFWSQVFHPSPGIGACGKCRTTWDFVNGHTTPYRGNSGGCFPLCEACWAELSPQARVPYYRALYAIWQRNADEDGREVHITWAEMEDAVLNEAS